MESGTNSLDIIWEHCLLTLFLIFLCGEIYNNLQSIDAFVILSQALKDYCSIVKPDHFFVAPSD